MRNPATSDSRCAALEHHNTTKHNTTQPSMARSHLFQGRAGSYSRPYSVMMAREWATNPPANSPNMNTRHRPPAINSFRRAHAFSWRHSHSHDSQSADPTPWKQHGREVAKFQRKAALIRQPGTPRVLLCRHWTEAALLSCQDWCHPPGCARGRQHPTVLVWVRGYVRAHRGCDCDRDLLGSRARSDLPPSWRQHPIGIRAKTVTNNKR